MLAMADSKGRVWASVPGLANRARVPLEDAEEAINRFLSPDKYSRTPDHEGRRIEPIDGGWRLLNHEKYRSVRDEESAKESKRRYINARRAKEREASSTVEQSRTPSNTEERGRDNAEADTEAEADTRKERVSRKRSAHPCPDGVSDQVWQDWLELRKAKRAPVTSTVVASAMEEAKKAEISMQEFLSIWCSRGSQGMQADWIKPAEVRAVRSAEPPEPAWRKEQRERSEAFLGPYSTRAVKERMQSETTIEGASNAVPLPLR